MEASSISFSPGFGVKKLGLIIAFGFNKNKRNNPVGTDLQVCASSDRSKEPVPTTIEYVI